MTIAAFLLGGTVGSGLPIRDAFIAVFAGSLVLTFVAVLSGMVGARTHLSTAMISRFAFGEKGSYLTALVLALGSYGWFGVQTGLFGETAFTVFQHGGFEPPVLLLVFVGGLLMTSTAIFGYRAIEKLSLIAVPALVILMFASLVMVLRDNPWGELVAAPVPGDPMPMGVAISIVAGSFMVGAVVAPDITRYARNSTHAVLAAVLGFQVGNVIIVFVGAILAHATGESEIVQIMLTLGWGVVAFLVLILSQWTTNDNNLYSAALAFSLVFRRWPKWKLTAVAGVLGTLLAMVGILQQLEPFLLALSALVPPIGGVFAADYFVVNRRVYRFENLSRVPAIRHVSWTAWVCGSLVAFMTTPEFPGLGLFQLTTVSAIDSFLVAFVLQLVLAKAFQRGEWGSLTSPAPLEDQAGPTSNPIT
ncbi:cytosine permease [Allosalinactinospora lopnorensis]|uniref:cytosine permease n=1 Tax=Allosalinactinospora lopnorensis TaxID=1352348 RepID=UPI000B2C0D35|nr:cytosine permease [Allosalinactinospora lopnorensis]